MQQTSSCNLFLFLFIFLVEKGKALDEAARSATASNLIGKIAEGVGHLARLEDIRVVTRRLAPPPTGAAALTGGRLPLTTGSVIIRVHAARAARALLTDVDIDGR